LQVAARRARRGTPCRGRRADPDRRRDRQSAGPGALRAGVLGVAQPGAGRDGAARPAPARLLCVRDPAGRGQRRHEPRDPGGHSGSSARVSLAVALERELPSRLPAGRGTVVFVVGTCWAPGRRLTGLEIVVDGEAQPVSAFGMPRPDLGEAPPERRHGGFWATVMVAPRGGAPTLGLTLRARCEDGSELSAELGTIEVAEPVPGTAVPPGPEPAAPVGADTTIAVCLAT